MGRCIVRVCSVILGIILGWGLIRLVFPGLDYHPPESLIYHFERSWLFTAGLLHVGLLAGLMGAGGVFAGAFTYEWLTSRRADDL